MSERKSICGVKYDKRSQMLKKEKEMIRNERHEEILRLLDTNTYMSVKRLSEALFVSMPTVRRDLAELEREGLVVRSHGGAKKMSDGDHVVPIDFRAGYKISEKKELCKRAAALVSDGDMIYIDESTSALYVGEFITAKNVTAVTNGMLSANILIKHGIKTYLTGGEMFESSLCTFGKMSEDFVSLFNFDLVFFSAYGISTSGMISDTNIQSAALRREVFKYAKKKVFIGGSEKFNNDAPYNVIHIDDVDYMITN